MPKLLKTLLRGLLGEALYFRAATKYVWGKTWFNYLCFRLPGLGRWARAWPHALYIEGTNVCNARCIFCAYAGMQRPKGVLPWEVFRSAVDQYAALGGDEVDLTGIVGEPFADPQLFARLDYLSSLAGLRRFHFFTNAIAMDPARSLRLLDYGERLWVYVSLGGFDRETYRRVCGVDKFEAAAEHLRGLITAKARSGSKLQIKICLRTPKGGHRGEFWDYLLRQRDAGLVSITWMGAYDNWGGHVTDKDLRAAGLEPRPLPVKHGPCHRLLTSPVVLSDGRVNACACRDVDASLIIGDIGRQSLRDILSGPALRGLVARHSRGDYPEVCQRCTYYESVLPGWWVGGPGRSDPSTPDLPEA